MTVSTSGEMWRPKKVSSSPVLMMTVRRCGSRSELRPRRKRAAPTPPARTVTRSVRLVGCDPAIRGCALFRNPSRRFDKGTDLLDRDVLTGIAPRGLGDLFFHECSAEVVDPGLERQLRQ